MLLGEPGAYCLVKPLDSLQVPATVQAVLAARIDRLPAEEKHLIQTAAVIGTEVSFSLLQAIAELPEAALTRSLAHLQAAEFLYETRIFPEREYTFKHALTHEVAYGSQLHERRRVLHARLVEPLETVAGEQLADRVERLAYHALRGEVWDKAPLYSRRSGDRAAARSAYREAGLHFEQALVALQHLPESHDRSAQAIDLLLSLREVLVALAAFDRALDCLNQAEALAESLGDHSRLGRVFCYSGLQCFFTGEYQQGLAMCQRALTLAEAHHDIAVQAPTRDYLGRTYYMLGDYVRGIEILTENVASLGGDFVRERFGTAGFVAVTSRHFLGQCYAEIGAFAQGHVCADEAVRIAEAAEHPHSLVSAYVCAGRLACYHGDPPKAIERLERALAICQQAHILIWLPIAVAWLAHAYALAARGMRH